jgi:hypothetical protein
VELPKISSKSLWKVWSLILLAFNFKRLTKLADQKLITDQKPSFARLR